MWRALFAGIVGSFFGNAWLGVLFTSSPVQSILYNPDWQSQMFLEITPTRNVPLSVIGLIILSATHGWLFKIFSASIPGHTWWQKGLFWGTTIWLLFWVSQEWFIYHTLLNEPLLLNALELVILLSGSLIEGLIIARILRSKE